MIGKTVGPTGRRALSLCAALVLALLGTGLADSTAAAGSLWSDLLNVGAVTAALDDLPVIPNTAWGIDPVADQVVLTISDAAPAAGVRRLLGLAGRFGPLVRVLRTTGVMTEQLADGDTIDNGHLICSVGFNVVRAGQSYLLTAGHCTAGLPYWQGVGPTVASNFPDTDFGLVRNDTGGAVGAVDRYDGTTQPITSVGTARVGERVCASGQTTGVTCGQVIAVDQTVNYGDGQVVHGLIQTNVHTDHGDSGGPLFDGTVGLGTVSGGDGQTDFFQPLAVELSTYGVTLA